MLILVGVSVNLIVNSNLIGETEKAGATHENAVAEEQKLSPNIGEWKTVDDYLREAGVVEEIHNWQFTDETRGAINCKCDLCKQHKEGDPTNGLTLEIGQAMAYEVEREKEVEKGEVIASTKISAEKSGTSSEQTVEITEEPIWYVLGAEDKNNNGTNETLLLTTKNDNGIGIKYNIEYKMHYNLNDEMNRICRELYGKKARSITIEDVNRALGIDEEPKGMKLDYLSINVNESNLNLGFSIIDKNQNKRLNELGETWEKFWAYVNNKNTSGKIILPEYYPNGIPFTTEEEKVKAKAIVGKIKIDGYIYFRIRLTRRIFCYSFCDK